MDDLLREQVEWAVGNGRGTVQFDSLPPDEDLELIANELRNVPAVHLRAYGSYDGSITDLEFLRYFPFIKHFAADALRDSLTSLDGLRHLEAPESLIIGETRRKLSLRVLEPFTGLRKLWLEKHTNDIEVLARLTGLVDLTLASITLPDLSFLRPLERLRAFGLLLGGTTNLDALPEIGAIEYLELCRVNALTDLAVADRLAHLRTLHADHLPRVEAVPQLSHATKLTHVALVDMNGLRDLSALRGAPALEYLFVSGPLAVDDFTCLTGHPTLRAARAGLGSVRKNQAVQQMLGLPDDDPELFAQARPALD